MHMGSMAVLGVNKPKNLIHVVINNGAHVTVGGMPTVAANIDLLGVAKASGYPNAVSVDSFETLDKELNAAKGRNELSLIKLIAQSAQEKTLADQLRLHWRISRILWIT